MNNLVKIKNKLLFLLFILIVPLMYAQNQSIKINYFVNDYGNLLTSEQIEEIESVLKEIYNTGLAEYAVVIVNSLEGKDIESYSYNLAEGILGKKEKNNGLLLLIALEDRQYRFEVGRGLEPILPDIVMARIGRNYIEPNFRNGDYAKGILESSYAIKDVLLNNTDSNYFVAKKEDTEFTTGLVIFIVLLIIFIFIFFVASKNSKSIKREEDYFFAGLLLGNMMKGGKFGKGGFSGGSFGNFSGGSFGGGGSSGRW